MKRLLFLILICCVSHTYAQQTLLVQIEQNNTILSALRQQADAEKIGNKTGIYLENPAIEYHYLWGNSAETGNRTDFEVRQPFDFPTAYFYKKKVSETQNQQVDLKYLIERKNILLEAKQLCIRLTYQNALYNYLSERMNATERMVQAYEKKFRSGEINALDYNRTMLNFLSVQKEFNSCQTEREYLTDELVRLNGGIAIDYPTATFEPVLINPDFEALYPELKEKNRSLIYFQQETALGKTNEKLRRSLNLPKFSAGYMSEKVLTEHFRGVTVGVSIPLWENKNTVKQLKAQTQANQATEEDANLRYRNETKALHKKALSLSGMVEDSQVRTLSVNSVELLKKALEAGEISIIDYILETEIYFEVTQGLLETERDLHLTVAELLQWDL
jgi:outer membrane protein TolC